MKPLKIVLKLAVNKPGILTLTRECGTDDMPDKLVKGVELNYDGVKMTVKSVGYELGNCKHLVWARLTLKNPGDYESLDLQQWRPLP